MFKRLIRFFTLNRSAKRSGSRGFSFDRELIKNRWSEIEELLRMGGASRLKSAILEADKLVDYTLKGKGFKGETMGDRLKSAQNSLSKAAYNSAWQGHKLRNRLVHEIDADVLFFEVKAGVENFRLVLRELGVL